jgi:predicted amidohydrolase
VKLAAVQYRPPKGRVEEARADLVRLLDEAGNQGADLVVFPEMATSGYVWSNPAEVAPHAEDPRGPTFRALAAGARRHGAWVVCGFPERFVHPNSRRADGRVGVSFFNSAWVITPTGELATCYRKVLLFEADTSWANPGWRRPVCRTEFGRVAPGICMDLNDPGFVRHLTDAEAEVVAFCTNWVDEGVDVLPYWRERLAGWSGWFVAANTWGTDRAIRFSGRSAILAPGGRAVVLAEREGDAVLMVDTEAAG